MTGVIYSYKLAESQCLPVLSCYSIKIRYCCCFLITLVRVVGGQNLSFVWPLCLYYFSSSQKYRFRWSGLLWICCRKIVK